MAEKFLPNELHPALLGPAGLNPTAGNISAGRAQMFSSSHLGQMLVISGASPRGLQTGMEREYGKYTFRVEMPCNGKILKIIPRYAQTHGINSIHHNPQSVVIYEDSETKEIGIINLVDYACNHQYFGFQYVKKPGYSLLREGADIPKGTVFLDSPNVTADGDYMYGKEVETAYMTLPGTSEDGIIISDDLLPELSFYTYETRVIEWGKKNFALNLYGDENNYKAFPDIGEAVRSDGVLMALRSFEPLELAIIEQSRKDCMEVDYRFDQRVYVNGPGGVVVDVKIHHDLQDQNVADIHMDGQAQKYDTSRRVFYHKIVMAYNELKRHQQEALQITPEFQNLLVVALSVEKEGDGPRVTKQHRKAPLDLYRVEITVRYHIVPGIGNKLTDCHGGKGVICKIVPAAHMPVDADGNRAQIIMDPNSTINRTNPGRFFEQYFNASQRDTRKRLCKMVGVEPGMKAYKALDHLQRMDQVVFQQAWKYLMDFYALVTPIMRGWFDDGQIEGTPHEYLAEYIQHPPSVYFPPNNPPMFQDIVEQLEREELGYKPCYGPVTYTGNSGIQCVTYNKVRIGSVYFIELEKIGDDWGSVASGKLQHHGVLSQLTRTDKYNSPARNQPVRGAGEAEVRIFTSYNGSEFTAEMHDRNNNPQTHRVIVDAVLSADRPSNVDNLVDRGVYPFGGSKPHAITNHMLVTSGLQFTFTPYADVAEHYDKPSYTSNREAIAEERE